MDFKKIISTILLIIWMVVIFLFSNETAALSQSRSDNISKATIDTISNITGKEYTREDKNNFILNSRYVIRKTAHFTLYFVLGILSIITLKSYGVNQKLIIYSILLCLLYAISDEIHQLFRTGRTFKIIDILIDSCGSSIGIFLVYLIKYKNSKKTCFFKEKMV